MNNKKIIQWANDEIMNACQKQWSVPISERPEGWKIILPEYEDLIIKKSSEEERKRIHKIACEFYDIQFISKLEEIFKKLKKDNNNSPLKKS